MKHLSEMVGAFIMQGSEEMYRFNIKEISKQITSKYSDYDILSDNQTEQRQQEANQYQQYMLLTPFFFSCS